MITEDNVWDSRVNELFWAVMEMLKFTEMPRGTTLKYLISPVNAPDSLK